ncbi:DUF6266 family protein [Pedobacter sp. ASV1-7]|uniref:DUF6266 family protein n=1 Tax=Pedobacter sp. ASV1-7 TaxID=3145237 RepID=UPI0032E92259
MGILKSGLHGPVRNKTGPSVTRVHRNINVVTAAYRKSNNPPTTEQMEIQRKFGLLSSFLSHIDDLIKTGFKHYSKGKDPVNVAYSYNYNHAFVINETGIVLNYPALKYSRGYIAESESPGLLALPEQIEFSWLPQRQSNYCQYTDLATFLVCNPIKETVMKQVAVTDRYEQGYLLNTPKSWAGDVVHCYMNFSSKDRKLQGNSSYVGEILCI